MSAEKSALFSCNVLLHFYELAVLQLNLFGGWNVFLFLGGFTRCTVFLLPEQLW
jgi:hypothetical protein